MKRTWYRSGDALLQDFSIRPTAAGEVFLWHLGQCGFLFLSPDCSVLFDGVLTDLTDAAGKTRRLFPPPFDPARLRVDYAICSHGHRDHLTPETLCALATNDSETRFIVPGGCLEQVEKAGIPAERVICAAAGQTLELPGLTLRCVQAAHPVHVTDARGRDVALCYALEMNGVMILHLGDTYLTEQLLEDLGALPRPDIFLPPINGGDYFRTARNCIGNLNHQEAAQLAVLLGADMTIPTHFDMMSGNTSDPLAFIRLLLDCKSDARWRIPALGERIIYRK